MPKKKRSRDKREIVNPSDPQQRRLIQAQVEASVTSGPLPPPEVLIRYNEAVPNGAERIWALWFWVILRPKLLYVSRQSRWEDATERTST